MFTLMLNKYCYQTFFFNISKAEIKASLYCSLYVFTHYTVANFDKFLHGKSQLNILQFIMKFDKGKLVLLYNNY